MPQKLDLSFVKKLQAELRRMTKIYQSLPSEESDEALKQFREAKQLFLTFRQNIEELVKVQILPVVKNEVRTADIKTAMHRFGQDLRNIWPWQNDSNGEKVDAPWRLNTVRPAALRAYQRSARNLFTALTDYVEYKERVGEETDVLSDATERTNIAGLQIVIHNEDRTEAVEADLKTFLQNVDRALAKMKRAGFAKSYQDMTLHVGLTIPKGGQGGTYHISKDELWVHLLGLEADGRTLIHETGHRFYFRNLGGNARAEWERIIGERMVKVTKEAVDLWMKALERKPGLATRKEYLSLATSLDVPESMMAQLRYLANHMPAYTIKPDEIRQHLQENSVGQPVALEHITDYGASNAQEAFAEAFALYVLKGPGALGPWTRQFFKDVSRSSGAHIRGAMADVVAALRATADKLETR